MATLKHTLMREDISTVNARQFSAERNDITIAMALDAIGALPRVLLLTDEEDGIWTMNSSLTIPGNVILQVPLGVTIVGPGNITIVGGIETLRWPVHLGPGTIITTNATLTRYFSKLSLGNLYSNNAEFDTLTVRNFMVLGHWEEGAQNPPPPADFPAVFISDWGATFYNQALASGSNANTGALSAVVQTQLTANTLSPSGNVGVSGGCELDLNGYHFAGYMRAAQFVPQVYGIGGVIDNLSGVIVDIYCGEQSTTTQAIGFHTFGVHPSPTGICNSYIGFLCSDVTEAGRITGRSIAYKSDIFMLGVEDRWNFYAYGNAPNYFGGKVGIKREIIPTDADLTIIGTASKTGAGAWADSSSQRHKRNIRDLTDALDTLCLLEGKTFEWDEPDHARLLPGRQPGLIAENVIQVIPSWIEELDDGDLRMTIRGELAYIVEAFREVRTRLVALEGNERHGHDA